MPTKTKAFYKTLLFWEMVIGGALLLCAAVILAVNLKKPAPAEPTGASSAYTEPTEATTPAAPVANPLQPNDFAFKGDYLTCLAVPSVLGIDVSEWQENIDWQQVKAAGVEFVMLRAGWRGSEQGLLFEDTLAQSHYAGAKAAGLKVGAYFFSQAVSVEEAVEEANFLLDIIKDWKLDMPVVYDWEHIQDSYRTGAVDAQLLTDCTKAFCDTVAEAGYQPMVYFNSTLSFDLLYLNELTDYKFWLAQYSNILQYPHRVDMWQYTETGSVPGIGGNVDINLYFPWLTVQ